MLTLEQRVVELERQVGRLLDREQQSGISHGEPWWKRHVGAFANDPLYDEAMRLGSEYRRAQPTAAESPDEFTA